MMMMTGNEASIYIYAARYAHNRKTGAALQVVNEIIRNRHRFPPCALEQIIRESSEATVNKDDWNKLVNVIK